MKQIVWIAGAMLLVAATSASATQGPPGLSDAQAKAYRACVDKVGKITAGNPSSYELQRFWYTEQCVRESRAN